MKLTKSEMPKWRKDEIEKALQMCINLANSTSGTKGSCGCFRIKPFNKHWDKKTVREIKHNVQLYVKTWIIPNLKNALKNNQFDD